MILDDLSVIKFKEKDTQTTLSIHPFIPLLTWYGYFSNFIHFIISFIPEPLSLASNVLIWLRHRQI